MPKIPLIEELTAGPVPTGSNLLVEFDAASQWYNASLTIAAGWLRTGGSTVYNVSSQPPDKVRAQLNRLGVDTVQLEEGDRLEIWDLYTATLGQKSTEKYGASSLKVADLSIAVSKPDQGNHARTRIAKNTRKWLSIRKIQRREVVG